MDVDAVADELRLDAGGVKGGADDAGGAVVEGRHSVVEVGGMGGARRESGHGGVVVRHGVTHGDRDAHFRGGADELHGAGLLRGNRYQLYTALRGLLEATEHGHIRVVEEVGVLGAFFRRGEEGAFQMGAHYLGAAGVFRPVGRGVFADGRQLVLRQRHAGGADVGDALAQLIVGNALQALRCGVAEILAHAAVEMHVHQAGDHIAASGIQDLFITAGGGKQSAVGADVPGDKALF